MDTKELEEQKAGDRKADLIGIMVIFACLIMGAIHFVSGWTF
ncbi:MAG: hypothetical protein O7G86_03670 [Gammaproteobacteria bacterium]|nr:hypothetical protein [Gammaproteobacteria bacterium]